MWKTADGKVILDRDNRPLLDFNDILPYTISSEVEQPYLEAWMRMNSKIKLRDLRGRMLRDPYSRPGKISEKDPLREGTISMAGQRLRKRAGIVSWDAARRNDRIYDYLMKIYPQSVREANSIRWFRDLLPHEIAHYDAINKGTHHSRRRVTTTAQKAGREKSRKESKEAWRIALNLKKVFLKEGGSIDYYDSCDEHAEGNANGDTESESEDEIVRVRATRGQGVQGLRRSNFAPARPSGFVPQPPSGAVQHHPSGIVPPLSRFVPRPSSSMAPYRASSTTMNRPSNLIHAHPTSFVPPRAGDRVLSSPGYFLSWKSVSEAQRGPSTELDCIWDTAVSFPYPSAEVDRPLIPPPETVFLEFTREELARNPELAMRITDGKNSLAFPFIWSGPFPKSNLWTHRNVKLSSLVKPTNISNKQQIKEQVNFGLMDQILAAYRKAVPKQVGITGARIPIKPAAPALMQSSAPNPESRERHGSNPSTRRLTRNLASAHPEIAEPAPDQTNSSRPVVTPSKPSAVKAGHPKAYDGKGQYALAKAENTEDWMVDMLAQSPYLTRKIRRIIETDDVGNGAKGGA